MAALLILTVLAITASVSSHSWLTCPPSFMNTDVGRGGEQENTCENDGRNAFVTEVKAGDRLKLGWTSNNHGGGFVRLSLVPYGQQTNEATLRANVLKFVCFGHDTRPHKTLFGDCKHPCDARKGCEYQSDIHDVHRFDTTITIPTNLPDGDYVIQAAMLVGNSVKPYNSCSKLRIADGNPSFYCKSNKEILKYACLKAGGPALEGSSIEQGTRRGDFCYRLNGEIGSIDEYIRDVPFNVECDARLSCANSVDGRCSEVEGMNDIMTPNLHPRTPNCHVYSRIPDPLPSCTDGIKNRDEEKVDCGGSVCDPCPYVKFEGNYYDSIKSDIQLWAEGAGGSITIKIHFIKEITSDQCWTLNTQFKVPISIDNTPWGDGMLIEQHPDLKIIIFQSNYWNSAVNVGTTLSLTMQMTNIEMTEAINAGRSQDEIDKLRWDEDKLAFLTAMIEVHKDKTKDCVEEGLQIG